MAWKIDGKTPIPPFVMAQGDKEGTHELRIAHHESGAPWDFPVKLELLDQHPGVAIITATDRRYTDGSKHHKFTCYSFDDQKRIVTSYLLYGFAGPVIVQACNGDNEEKRSLLEKIDMEHFNLHPDTSPERLIARHLERIAGRSILREGLRDSAERTYFDMLYSIREFYGIYSGPVPEIPTDEERASVERALVA